MYRYEMSPIDFFNGCIRLTDYLISLEKDILAGIEDAERVNRQLSGLIAEMSKMKFWDGDISDGIYVFAIPSELETEIGFIWKQSNNGTTFVVSPIPLPHLEEHSI